MSKHLSQQDLPKYLSQTLQPDELLIFDTHLAECDQCFDKTNDFRSMQLIASSLPDAFLADVEADDHLTYDQFASYVDGEIGEIDKEIVEVHKMACSDCSEQIDELFQLRATLEIETEPVQTLVASPGTDSLSNWWNGITTGSLLKFAAPAFAVLLIGIIIWAAWFLTRTPSVDTALVPEPAVNPVRVESNSESIAEVPDNTESQNVNSAVVSQPQISLADGGTRIEIDSAGNIKGLNAPQFENRVRSALTTQNIEIAQAARELRSKSGVLMGDGQPGTPFGLMTPVGKIVQSDRPQFRWRPLKDAESYVVTIFDANFNRIAESPSLRQSSWTAGTRLKRGTVYQWQVTATKDGQEVKSPVRPAPDARFKILEAGAANDIAAAKRQNGNSHLLLGILYANAGLLDEAESELQALLKQNPKSEIARKLLRKVQASK